MLIGGAELQFMGAGGRCGEISKVKHKSVANLVPVAVLLDCQEAALQVVVWWTSGWAEGSWESSRPDLGTSSSMYGQDTAFLRVTA